MHGPLNVKMKEGFVAYDTHMPVTQRETFLVPSASTRTKNLNHLQCAQLKTHGLS
jgi:hypothetical protein